MAFAVEINLLGGFEYLEDALFCQRRAENDGEVGEGRHAFADGIFEVGDDLLVLFFDGVPFVDYHHKTLVVALHQLEDVQVLAFDTAGGIDEQNADIGVFDGANGTHHAVEFQVLRHLILFTDAGSVHKVEIESELVVFGKDRIACGACNVGNNVTIFADEGVDEGAFPGIRAADNRKAGDVGIALVDLVGR